MPAYATSPARLPRSVLVGGRRWRIVWVDDFPGDPPGDETGGECDAPETARKSIRIRRGLDDEALARVVVHELIHAGCFALDEPTTDAIAIAAASLLTRLGFRRTNHKE